MKQIACILLLTLGLSSCFNAVQERENNALDQFYEEPIIITWDTSSNTEVQSYQANVQVFSMNNRKDTSVTLSNSYKLAVMNISGQIFTRIDFNSDDTIPFRSFISDGEEFIAFNPETEEIGFRIPIEESKSPLYRIFGNQCGLSRVNLSLIRTEAQRLSLSLSEDREHNTLLLDIPPALIPQNGLDRIIQSRVVFNLANETVLESEVIMVREDETLVTTSSTPIYEDKNGVPVKIGMVTVIDSKAPSLIEDIDPELPVYNSPEDIPIVSADQFAEMQGEGTTYETPGMIFGDPADLSYVETVYEVYQGIEINAVPQQLFRLIGK